MRSLSVALSLAICVLATESRADPIVPASLQGEWTTDCLPIGQNSRHGMITLLTIDGSGRMAARSQVFASNACRVPTVQARYETGIVEVSEDSEAIRVALKVESITLKTNQDEVTAIYNDPENPAGCGLAGWQTNIARPVDGRTCAVFDLPEVDEVLQDRVWADGTRLAFGAYPLKWTIRSEKDLPKVPSAVSFYRTGY
ncbi:hypothetical protein [Roseibium sediminicola]|uniref:Protease inhibitor Inh n=1 Tax=Roseibium sediminicola TaxID=2933272 RepID=A0ABT0GZT8_9HYPH|nr:hypothetical protein [Roseibium sp. CAU 1639]MCK7614353.1 hypothetical protein [Roseibium sp. CAU 1639]